MVEVPGTLNNEYSEIKVIIDGESYVFETPFRLLEPSITGLSTDKIKYGNVLTIYGENFNTSPFGTMVYINGNSKNYMLTHLPSPGQYIILRKFCQRRPVEDQLPVFSRNARNSALFSPGGDFNISISPILPITHSPFHLLHFCPRRSGAVQAGP